jgi:hypothetical protein
MSSFDSLTLACEDWFDKPLCDLPAALRQRLEEDFLPMPWDRLSAADRRDVTQKIDYRDDPAKEEVRQFCWDQSERMISLTTQIEKWEVVATPTALDLAQKERRLAELLQELARVNAEVLVEGGPRESPSSPLHATKRKIADEHLPAPVDIAPAEKPGGSTVRREAGKLRTLNWYKQLQTAYRAVKKDRPNMSDVWYSQHIAKMPIAKNRSPETIRKHMKL